MNSPFKFQSIVVNSIAKRLLKFSCLRMVFGFYDSKCYQTPMLQLKYNAIQVVSSMPEGAFSETYPKPNMVTLNGKNSVLQSSF